MLILLIFDKTRVFFQVSRYGSIQPRPIVIVDFFCLGRIALKEIKVLSQSFNHKFRVWMTICRHTETRFRKEQGPGNKGLKFLDQGYSILKEFPVTEM